MKKAPAAGKAPTTAAKKVFDPNSYVNAVLPREEVIEIKQAFDIFDTDGSGAINPIELKDAFVDLGFTGMNKFVYQILAELDDNASGGIDFDEFLTLATAKVSEKDSRADINKIFHSFDKSRQVPRSLTPEKVHRR
jgi:centrin-1